MVREEDIDLMCSEVLAILKLCPKIYVDKINKNLIKFLEENQRKNVNIKLDPNISIFEQDVTDDTLIMMFMINRDYWSTEEEKAKLDKIIEENDERCNRIFNYNNMFNERTETKEKEVTEKERTTDSTNNMQLVKIKKEPYFKRILKKIISFFNNK